MWNCQRIFASEVHVRCWQSMDLGVLRQFKCKYCSHLLQSLLANAETCKHAYKFSSRITVLDAVRWISQSWNQVDAEVIIKCFQLSSISSAEDPIPEQDDNVVCINELVTLHTAVSERHLVTDDVINAQDYAAIDDELDVYECTEGTSDEFIKKLYMKSSDSNLPQKKKKNSPTSSDKRQLRTRFSIASNKRQLRTWFSTASKT
ncbi:Tigger transposable element-derived protein [Trichinella spiralis]|uniref:Tigger transposable element-derived protein n=1 Tax=Trichinella spiralis TaxID=6334 RepID=A0ABR3K7G1_TRISP